MATTAVKKKTGSMKAQHVVSRVLIYALLIIVAALMLIPFLWMLSASRTSPIPSTLLWT